jgi:uncharacterized protein (TIGR00288 family)
MAISSESVNIAIFCDFENVALGVRDARLDKLDIKPVLERLLLKGSIVVKKAYCDWERYKGFKAAMHEANFELIEIPHVRQSGKNSADIRMVVDALDLCYTKAHVDTFVIVSGDSDFSPLVSKLRENAKHVIGVGIKQSSSDLLIANCDEFIFYDDLARENHRPGTRRDPKAAPRLSPEEFEARKTEAIDLAVTTFEALAVERGESGKIWSSMLKEAMKRRKPDFNESHFGFRSFGNLLEEAQARGLLEVGRDEKSGAFVSRSTIPPSVAEPAALENPAGKPPETDGENATVPPARSSGRHGRNRGKNNGRDTRKTEIEAPASAGEASISIAEKEAEPSPEEPAARFPSFGDLLEEAHARGLMKIGQDEKPGAAASRDATGMDKEAESADAPPAPAQPQSGRRGRGPRSGKASPAGQKETKEAKARPGRAADTGSPQKPAATEAAAPVKPTASRGRGPRKPKATALQKTED